MAVVPKLMAQLDNADIPFAAMFAMLKVKMEHSYPGECLSRHTPNKAAVAKSVTASAAASPHASVPGALKSKPSPVLPKKTKKRKKKAAPPPSKLTAAANTVRARVRIVAAFRSLVLGTNGTQALDDAKAQSIVEKAVSLSTTAKNWHAIDLAVQKQHIRRQLEEMLGRRDPHKMAVVPKLMAQLDNADIPFAAMFAMLKVKMEHSYPGECLSRHTPNKAAVAKSVTASAAASPHASKALHASKSLEQCKAVGNDVTLSEDTNKIVADAKANALRSVLSEKPASAAAAIVEPRALRTTWKTAFHELHRQHIEAQLIDILSRRAPQKLRVVPKLMAQFDSPDIHFKAVFAMLKVKIEHSYPGEVFTDFITPIKRQLPDLNQQ